MRINILTEELIITELDKRLTYQVTIENSRQIVTDHSDKISLRWGLIVQRTVTPLCAHLCARQPCSKNKDCCTVVTSLWGLAGIMSLLVFGRPASIWIWLLRRDKYTSVRTYYPVSVPAQCFDAAQLTNKGRLLIEISHYHTITLSPKYTPWKFCHS